MDLDKPQLEKDIKTLEAMRKRLAKMFDKPEYSTLVSRLDALVEDYKAHLSIKDK